MENRSDHFSETCLRVTYIVWLLAFGGLALFVLCDHDIPNCASLVIASVCLYMI